MRNKGHVRTRKTADIHRSRKGPREQPTLLASSLQNCEKIKFLLLTPPRLQYFVLTALANIPLLFTLQNHVFQVFLLHRFRTASDNVINFASTIKFIKIKRRKVYCIDCYLYLQCFFFLPNIPRLLLLVFPFYVENTLYSFS